MAGFFDFTRLIIGDVVSGKAKSAPITYDGLREAVVEVEPMQVKFEPSAYQDDSAQRVNIVWQPTPDLVSKFSMLDLWVVEQVAAESVKYFGKERSVDQIKDCYLPIIKASSDKYPPLLKAKMNKTPPMQCAFWDEQGRKRDAPESWVGAVTRPRLKLKGLYFMGGQFGPVLECMDLQILSEVMDTCPFGDSSDDRP